MSLKTTATTHLIDDTPATAKVKGHQRPYKEINSDMTTKTVQRPRRIWLVISLALAISALALMILRPDANHDARQADNYPTLSLSLLVMQAERQHGRTVATSGVVRGFDDPEHYWIEDAQLNRVALQPGELAKPWLGQQVHVTGRFFYPPEEGRRLELSSIQATP